MRKAKGYALLEVMLSIAISLIIAVILGDIIYLSIKDYKESMKIAKEYLYVSEALNFIDNEIHNETEDIEISGKSIYLKKKLSSPSSPNKMNIISLDGSSRVVIQYLEYDFLKSTNTILRNVEDFNLTKKNNLIYIKITLKTGKMVERCLSIL